MRVSITGINFEYDDGYNEPYTSVVINYVTNGFMETRNEPITISKEEYEANKSNSDGLKAIIVNAKIAEANNYVTNLNNYLDSLTGLQE